MAVRDTFTEASNTAIGSHTPDTADASEVWTAWSGDGAGTWQVNASDYAEATAISGAAGAITTLDTGSADGFVEADITVPGGTGQSYGLVFRANRSASTFLTLYVQATNNNWIIYSRTSGSWTNEASGTFADAQGTATRKFAVAFNGSSVKIYRDEVLAGTATVTTHQTNTEVGFRASIATTVHQFDNLRWHGADEDYDVTLLAGQSNMVGRATKDAADTHDWRVASLDQDGDLVPAYEPLRHLDPQADDMGLSLGYANQYVANSLTSGRYLLLVPAADGGTGFSTNEWNQGDSLYNNLVSLNTTALALGGANSLTALLWHQGEQETSTQGAADAHLQALRNFYEAIRSDLSAPSLRIVSGGLEPSWVGTNSLRTQVDDQIKQVADEKTGVLWVNTSDLSGSGGHFDRGSQLILGSRYASAAYEGDIYYTLTGGLLGGTIGRPLRGRM